MLERLKPGVMLSTLEDDEQATYLAAEVMQKIWRTGVETPSAATSGYSTSSSKFILLSDWFDGLKELCAMFDGGAGPLMINPWGSRSAGISNRLILRRVDILHEHLGWERERILEWHLAHGILSAWWGIEDKTGWEYALGFARLIAGLMI